MNAALTALPGPPAEFMRLVEQLLGRQRPAPFAFPADGDLKRISAVLFLLGSGPGGEPTLILNKRSPHVRQGGDLCFPGGGISPALDGLFARVLELPGTPLSRWSQGAWWRRHRRADYRKLRLLLAAALREALEEMRLNPFGITFLGPMPAQHLVMFQRAIYPMVGWVNRQRRFFPNWEVDKIVQVPIDALLDSGNYARYRISFKRGVRGAPPLPPRDMPCFLYRHKQEVELLWGATFRMVAAFLKAATGHQPPPLNSLPVIHRRLGRGYLTGTPKRQTENRVS
jgi:8-oxo-dGTP pyrophosphatase MutT (NUDIX family)